MAAIRFVDSWLRCPGAPASNYPSVMVVAEKWAEQRVLMRGYSESRDQTLPTILLHGAELAIGPAGLDINGPWGIHVADQGAATVVKQGLEEAARRLAGSKGNPPRLLDENQRFEPEPPRDWAPDAPGAMASRPEPRDTMVDRIAPPFGGAAGGAQVPPVDVVAPIAAARVPQGQVATVVPANEPRWSPSATAGAPQAARRTRPAGGIRTALGYASGAGAQSAIVRLGLAPHVSAKLGQFTDRVVAAEFSIDARERRALNALGEHPHVTARALGQLLDVHDAVSFMEELVRKLEAHGLGDLVEPAEPVGGEPTYRLRG
jgi:hypothetical protein